jgi:heat shock protein HtpX
MESGDHAVAAHSGKQAMNMIRTVVLLAALTGILIAAGQALGGREGAIIALVIAGVMNFGSYWFSDRIVLASYRAVPAERMPEGERLIRIVERLAMKSGQPMPRVYMIPSPSPNAFATGRDPDHAAVAATKGILDLLTDDELEGVMAHELSHVTSRDILTGSIVATVAGAISFLASMAQWAAIFGGGRRDDRGGAIGLLATAIVAPIAAMIIQMAISRSREYAADAGAAKLTQNPLGLARALEKLAAMSERRPMGGSPATAHLFIVNPLRGKGLANLFSTHPPVAQRVARLEAMAGAR